MQEREENDHQDIRDDEDARTDSRARIIPLPDGLDTSPNFNTATAIGRARAFPVIAVISVLIVTLCSDFSWMMFYLIFAIGALMFWLFHFLQLKETDKAWSTAGVDFAQKLSDAGYSKIVDEAMHDLFLDFPTNVSFLDSPLTPMETYVQMYEVAFLDMIPKAPIVHPYLSSNNWWKVPATGNTWFRSVLTLDAQESSRHIVVTVFRYDTIPHSQVGIEIRETDTVKQYVIRSDGEGIGEDLTTRQIEVVDTVTSEIAVMSDLETDENSQL